MQGHLDRAIDAALEEKRIVGTVVLVAHKGVVSYRRAAGFADREAQKSVREDTIFRLASLTKPIIAAIILKLQDEGRLSVDGPVTNYLPYFTPKMPDGTQPVIRLRHLLTHSAGLVVDVTPTPEELTREPLLSVNGSYRHLSLEDHLRRLASRPLQSAPGTTWAYGLSYDVLGAVAAKVFGGSVEEVTRHYITEPLGMMDTMFGVRDIARLAQPYADASPEPALMGEPHSLVHQRGHTVTFTPSRILDSGVFASGGGGLAGTAGDFMRFLIGLQWGGLLKPETHAAGLVPQISAPTQTAGQGQAFLGIAIDDPAASGTPQHAGSYYWGGVFGSSWFVDPKAELAVVAVTNTAFEGLNGQFAEDIRNAVYL
jgi:CubicO group peptidase (beta-lactamase class C family)